ncbi:UPF0481 protein At3g47200-like [Cornus florida]|uniref:UPF0481 protein At3g47200-like n=1 Tax=Cornus florida TaxID=4283 RepID=UPI0028A0B2D0|nr:UPF0481 protein At3g47200-like [Cornus florida]
MANDRNCEAEVPEEDISGLLGYLQIKIVSNKEKIEALKPFKEEEKELPTIHRVPDVFHKMNELAYSPSVVAIGPLHGGKKVQKHLQAMEVEKLSYMHHLFERTENFEKTRHDCVAAMLKLESNARRCYADDVRLDFTLDEDDNPVDANCCTPEKFRSYLKEIDPIAANNFKFAAVEQDLLLLENQLPFFVLDKLFGLTVGRSPEYCSHGPSCYLPTGSHQEEKTEETADSDEEEKMELVLKNFKYSATELDLGGTKFVQGNKENIFDVKFTTHHSYFPFRRGGEFEIPPFTVNDWTELILRNLIAFEQSCPLMVKSYFTSHAFLMDRLINTAEDVKLLEKEEIICNKMGCREEVASLFNKLCKNIAIDSLYSTNHCLEVINFHKHRWPKFQVKLKRDYFSNPWTIISVAAAFVLFGLTLMQTIFAVPS